MYVFVQTTVNFLNLLVCFPWTAEAVQVSLSLSEQGTSLFHHFKIENKIKCKRAWGRHLAITTISHQPTEVKNLTANESARQHNIKLATNRVKTICVYIHMHVCMYVWVSLRRSRCLWGCFAEMNNAPHAQQTKQQQSTS